MKSVVARARQANLRAYFYIEPRISPATRFSQSWYEERLAAAVAEGSIWLDVGCGHQILPSWRNEAESTLVGRARSVVGLDPDLESLVAHRSISDRVCGDLNGLPFPDKSFDLVTANMVVEHLRQPEVQFRELNRVLRPGGLFLFHTPNARGYTSRLARIIPESLKAPLVRLVEGRPSEDVFPAYYRANTVERLAELADQSGFLNEGIEPITSSATMAAFLPAALVELLWIRLLEMQRFSQWRQTFIGRFRRPIPAEEPL